MCKKSDLNVQTNDETLNPARTSETPQISAERCFKNVSKKPFASPESLNLELHTKPNT